MKLKHMEEGVRYVVTDCADEGSLSVGDRVLLDRGLMMNKDAGGWLQEKHWRRIRRAEVELDEKYYLEQESKYEKALGAIRMLLERHRGVGLKLRDELYGGD